MNFSAFVVHASLRLPSSVDQKRAISPYRTSVTATASESPRSPPLTRRAFLLSTLSTAGALAAATAIRSEEEIALKVVKSGAGPLPEIGDLVGIRFKGSYNDVVFDNLFDSPQPYFYRVGSTAVLKGIDETVLKMRVGDVVDVLLPSDKAFGKKGRAASAGVPSIPPNATISYIIELSTIPGKEEELLEGLADSDIGTSL